VTVAERVQAVVAKHFTERQARFLVTVMLHSGVCMRRHYCAFAGIRHGQVDVNFFDRLTTDKFATAFDCKHNRARIYHVHHRSLYEAIGEPHSRLRKPLALARAVENIMLLDAVIARRDITWLATEREKVEHFSMRVGHLLHRDEFPHLDFGESGDTTTRYFPDRLPIGVDPDRHGHLFLYLVTRRDPVDFRPFLLRHADLLRALPKWTLQLLVPAHLAESTEAYVAAARQELAAPLRASVVDELRWYFAERQRLAAAADSSRSTDPARYQRVRRAFGAPRYRVLYRTWTRVGDRAVNGLQSRVLADALERRSGRIEWQSLPRPYLHLSPLVGTA
jgi:hypothetical protein